MDKGDIIRIRSARLQLQGSAANVETPVEFEMPARRVLIAACLMQASEDVRPSPLDLELAMAEIGYLRLARLPRAIQEKLALVQYGPNALSQVIEHVIQSRVAAAAKEVEERHVQHAAAVQPTQPTGPVPVPSPAREDAE